MITAERLRELLRYNSETGEFTWLVNRSSSATIGAVAGRVNGRGYRDIVIGGKRHQEHRLAWFYEYGVWPAGQIDHINRKKDDNRISNLRIASNSQNRANASANVNNTSGFKGVTRSRNNWQAQIKYRGRYIYLGMFLTPEEASAAYRAAALHHFGEFACDG